MAGRLLRHPCWFCACAVGAAAEGVPAAVGGPYAGAQDAGSGALKRDCGVHYNRATTAGPVITWLRVSGGGMRGTEDCVRRLVEELEAERREFRARASRFEKAARRLAEMDERARSCGSAEGGDLLTSLSEVRAEVEALHGEFAQQWAERLRRWVGTLEDLTREVSRESGLTRLGELSASVAHEIRNPLCGILLSVEVLQTKMDAGDSRMALLDNLHREAEKMEKVVNNLLHFARHYKPRLVPCELTDVVQRSIESVHGHLKKSQMEVRVRRLALSCRADVDPDLMQQVFSNILLNSVDASPRGSTVDVEVGLRDAPALVAVAFRDEGEGIRSDIMESIFEPFVTSKANGIGLGLSVSKKIVEAHQGCIEVVSEPGKGTTFTVVFPQRAQREEARAAA